MHTMYDRFAIFFLLVAAFFMHLGSANNSKKPVVIIDTDMNTDDVMAIQYILKCTSEVHVAAISVVATGFCNMGPGINNLFGLLAFMDRNDVLVAPGEAYAHIEIESGEYDYRYQKSVPLTSRGSKLWADTLLGMARHFPSLPPDRYYSPDLKSYDLVIPQVLNATSLDTPIYILSLGPMTNINRLFRTQPWVRSRITRIYAMGGAIHDMGNLFWPRGKVDNPYAECNIFADPDSAKAVIASGVPITLVSLDATNYLQTTWEFINGMEVKSKEARFVHGLLRLIKANSAPTSRYSLWDPLTAGVLVDTHSVTVNVTTYNLDVITDWSSAELGRTIIDDTHGHPVQVVTRPDVAFYDIFTNRLNS